MAKANIKESMKKSIDGVLDLLGDEPVVVVDGFDEPLSFSEQFAGFHGRKVKIDISTSVEIRPEEE